MASYFTVTQTFFARSVYKDIHPILIFGADDQKIITVMAVQEKVPQSCGHLRAATAWLCFHSF